MSNSLIRHKWNDSKSRFDDIDDTSTQLSGPQQIAVHEVIRKIEAKSGIRRDHILPRIITFVLINAAGFGFGFLAISEQFQLIAGIVIIGTPFFSYFIIIGPCIVREKQLNRIDHYMKKNSEKLNENLLYHNLTLLYSFSMRTFSC